MTEVVSGAQAPNPYNAKSTPQGVPRGILNANDKLGNTPEQKVIPVEESDPAEDIKAEGLPDVPVEDSIEKFKKVDYKKRYDDLKRHYDSKLNEFKAKEEKMSQKIKDGMPKYVPPKTPEELATFREDDPEAYATIEAIADLRSQERAKEVQEKLDAIERREADIAKKEAFAQLAKLQPDFEEIKETQEFHDWVPNQPQDIQDWLYRSFNANLASRAIDLFKQDVGWKKPEVKEKPKPKEKPSAAEMVDVSTKSVPSTKEKKIWTTSEIKNLSRHNIAEYERQSGEIDKAFFEGRVVKG
jgi:hypothetical protein